jgi:hypothetical protein
MHSKSANIFVRVITIFIIIHTCDCQERYSEIVRDHYFEVGEYLIDFLLRLSNRIVYKKVDSPIATTAATTTTTAATTTLPPLICKLEGVFYNEEFEEIKNICFSDLRTTYAVANNYCTSNKMKLYSLQTSDEYNAITDYASSKFPTTSKNFWISSTESPIVELASGSKKCLSVSYVANGIFAAKANECEDTLDGFFCERAI